MRTQNTLDTLCMHLQTNCGDRLAAAQSTGVSLIFVNQWCKDDPKTAEVIAEAERIGTQGLVSAAIKRAVAGVEEDVYYKGEVVGQKTNYSDSLLTTLLKAKVPEFTADKEGGTNVTVNIAQIMPRATNYGEWLEMKRNTLAAPAASLPGPDVQDAEYDEITSNPLAHITL